MRLSSEQIGPSLSTLPTLETHVNSSGTPDATRVAVTNIAMSVITQIKNLPSEDEELARLKADLETSLAGQIRPRLLAGQTLLQSEVTAIGDYDSTSHPHIFSPQSRNRKLQSTNKVVYLLVISSEDSKSISDTEARLMEALKDATNGTVLKMATVLELARPTAMPTVFTMGPTISSFERISNRTVTISLSIAFACFVGIVLAIIGIYNLVLRGKVGRTRRDSDSDISNFIGTVTVK